MRQETVDGFVDRILSDDRMNDNDYDESYENTIKRSYVSRDNWYAIGSFYHQSTLLQILENSSVMDSSSNCNKIRRYGIKATETDKLTTQAATSSDINGTFSIDKIMHYSI